MKWPHSVIFLRFLEHCNFVVVTFLRSSCRIVPCSEHNFCLSEMALLSGSIHSFHPSHFRQLTVSLPAVYLSTWTVPQKLCLDFCACHKLEFNDTVVPLKTGLLFFCHSLSSGHAVCLRTTVWSLWNFYGIWHTLTCAVHSVGRSCVFETRLCVQCARGSCSHALDSFRFSVTEEKYKRRKALDTDWQIDGKLLESAAGGQCI